MKRPASCVAVGIAALLSIVVLAVGAPAQADGDAKEPSMATTAPEQTDRGAEEIMIDAGKKGSVFFPHRKHQETDTITCATCHDLFPQRAGSIALLKQEGTLAQKQVMTTLCIACHKETASAGKPSGPRACNVCHAK